MATVFYLFSTAQNLPVPCLVNCSTMTLFNGGTMATRGHSGPEVTSGHTFLGFVIISHPAAWGLHKNEIGHLNLRSSCPGFYFARFKCVQWPSTKCFHKTPCCVPGQSGVSHVVFVSSMNISQTTDACIYPVLCSIFWTLWVRITQSLIFVRRCTCK